MGFFNYVKAASKFKDNEYVLETIKRLKDFDEFHCLRDSSLLLAGRINQIIGKAPEAVSYTHLTLPTTNEV